MDSLASLDSDSETHGFRKRLGGTDLGSHVVSTLHADFELELGFESTGSCDGLPAGLGLTLAESLDLEGFDVVSEGTEKVSSR